MYKLHGLIAVLILALINAKFACTENDYYPGLRKPPQLPQNYLFTELKNIIDEQARRRFQEQLHKKQLSQQSGEPLTEEVSGPGFTYELPIQYPYYPIDDEKPFAYGPGNPKYYEKTDSTKTTAGGSNGGIDPLITYKAILNGENETPARLSSDGIPSYKVKAPMNINPKIITYDEILNNENDNSYEISKSEDVAFRDDLQKLFENLNRKGQGQAIVNYLNPMGQNDVAKKPVDLNSAWVIAVIAGVSAAFTVGLLAIGIGWYTLQKKAKAAADVDYPAYGITGPNKDISPSSGDRRLAQSAQMYHYQHQKQQIIAMENQNNGDQNGSLSDIETDEENEEGDYTVYECPGLAPTGDMEVKNPLFLDDPTPVQKGTVVLKSQQSQQQKPTKSQQPNPKNSEPATKK